jgi:HEPN domain-containing protein/predicted nucleotidyltransferase
MKSSLDHLPKEKQDLIRFIVNVIVEKIDPEKVILYGSYATGKWVEDEYYEEGHQMDYKSDYDFLIITKSGDRRSDYEVQEVIERRSGLNEHVSAITHDIDYINGKLSDGQYFFSDIEKEGILLYDAGNIPLSEKRNLTTNEKRISAQNDFDLWFNSANEFLIDAIHGFERDNFKKAAFELHQAAERFYNTTILVFRGYKPKTHNLEKLQRYAKHFSKELANVFPRKSVEEKHLFDLLKKGYIEARYDKKYEITKLETEYLIDRVKKMQVITEKICKEKISSF